MPSTFDRVERIGLLLLFLALIMIGLGCLFYSLFGSRLIESIYNGDSLPFLNQFIQHQQTKSLEHYLETGNCLFYRFLILSILTTIACWGICMTFYRLIVPSRPLTVGWVILLAMYLLFFLYLLSSRHRVLSDHGFLRASVVYQILNGQIPPQDPFFAGGVFRWPWGFEWLIAQISFLIQISPFYASAIVNILSLGLSLFLIYKISQCLIRDSRANLFSSLIAVFGVTIFSKPMILKAAEWIHPCLREIKAVPVFIRFSSFSGIPPGLVFFLLFVYAAIRLFKNRTTLFSLILLLTGIVGCGFIYTAFAPSLVASALGLCVILLFFRWREKGPLPWQPILLIMTALLLSGLSLTTYLSLVYSGIGQAATFFHPQDIVRHCSIALFLLFPMFLVISLAAKSIFPPMDRTVLILLASILLANAGGYLCIHFPQNSEYKFLLLFGVILGIFGGIALSRIMQRMPVVPGFILLLFFLSPSILNFHEIARRYNNHPLLTAAQKPYFLEKGTSLLSADKEENELYQWIKTNTSPNSIFIDSEWKIPVFAQRAMFIGMDKPDESWISGYGYGVNMEFIKSTQGYDENAFVYRRKVIRTVYGIEQSLPRSELIHFLSTLDLYIVVRPDETGAFDARGLTQVFGSSTGKFRLFRSLKQEVAP